MEESTKPQRKHANIHLIYGPVMAVELCMDAEKYGVKRGDFVVDVNNSQYGYRSSGVYFFDGRKLVSQDTDYDDYGTVPGEFMLISEFPPGYWDLPNRGSNGGGSYEVPSCREWFYGNGSLVPKPCSKIEFYWHTPENFGVSTLKFGPDTINSGEMNNYSVKIYDNHAIMTFSVRGQKYAVVTGQDTIEGVRVCMKDGKVWHVNTLYNSYEHCKYYTDVVNFLAEHKVPAENILCECGIL